VIWYKFLLILPAFLSTCCFGQVHEKYMGADAFLAIVKGGNPYYQEPAEIQNLRDNIAEFEGRRLSLPPASAAAEWLRLLQSNLDLVRKYSDEQGGPYRLKDLLEAMPSPKSWPAIELGVANLKRIEPYQTAALQTLFAVLQSKYDAAENHLETIGSNQVGSYIESYTTDARLLLAFRCRNAGIIESILRARADALHSGKKTQAPSLEGRFIPDLVSIIGADRARKLIAYVQQKAPGEFAFPKTFAKERHSSFLDAKHGARTTRSASQISKPTTADEVAGLSHPYSPVQLLALNNPSAFGDLISKLVDTGNGPLVEHCIYQSWGELKLLWYPSGPPPPKEPDDRMALILLSFYFHARKFQDAVILLDKFPNWNAPDLAMVHLNLGEPSPFLYMAAVSFAKVGRFDEAVRAISFDIQNRPNEDEIYALLVAIAPKRTMRILEQMHASFPNDSRPLIWQAKLLLNQDKLSDARAIALEGIRLDPIDTQARKTPTKLMAYSILADASRLLGRKDEAAKWAKYTQAARFAVESAKSDAQGVTDYPYRKVISDFKADWNGSSLSATRHPWPALPVVDLQASRAAILKRGGKEPRYIPNRSSDVTYHKESILRDPLIYDLVSLSMLN